MTIFPHARLLVVAAWWLGAAVIAAAWPPLIGPLVGALLILFALTLFEWRALSRRPSPTVMRSIPTRVVIDRPNEIVYQVRNAADTSIRVEVSDEFPPDLASQDPNFANVLLAAGKKVELRAVIRPKRRGDRPLGALVLFEDSPLALLRRRQVTLTESFVSVYPDAQRLFRAAALDPKRIAGQASQRATRNRGQGSDFESLRDYVVGDDPRRVDWAATARRGRVVTRLYRHERNHTVVLAVDRSRLMGTQCNNEQTKLDHAVDAALVLALAALAQGDRVEVLLFDREVRGHVAPRSHRGEVGPVVELLRLAEPTPVEPDYRKLAGTLLARRRSRALIVILTDFAHAASAGIESPLRLLQRHHRTLLVMLRDPLYSRVEPGADNRGGLFERLAINELLRDREAALARLQRSAVQSIDLPPVDIVAPVLNRYLAFRYDSR